MEGIRRVPTSKAGKLIEVSGEQLMRECTAVQWRALRLQPLDKRGVCFACGQENGQPLRGLHPGTQLTERQIDHWGAWLVRSGRPQLKQALAVILAVHVQEARYHVEADSRKAAKVQNPPLLRCADGSARVRL
eukprot:6408571-Prymnesium_polylepis.1